MLQSIMTEAGFERMQSYLETQNPNSEMLRRRIFAALLDKFVQEDALEEDIEIPGWSEALIDETTARYEDDVYKIERMSGVNFIAP